MCLAMLLKPGAELNMDDIERAWAANPDGGGYAFTADGEHITVRKFLHLKDMKEGLRKAHTRFGAVSPFLVHFRVGTHGVTDLSNVHPFMVREDLAMIHNGIIKVKTWDERSDTRTFVEDWLTSMPDDWLDNDVLTILVEEFIGWSKLVFLSVDPRLKYDWYILNEVDGHWSDDESIWYSNDSYKQKKARYVKPKQGAASYRPFRDDDDDDDWKGADVPDLASGLCYFCEENMSWWERPWCLGCEICNNCWQPCDECLCAGTPQEAKNAYLSKMVEESSKAESQYLADVADGKKEVL